MVIKAPGEVHWYKDMNSADDDTPSLNDANVSPIDLRSVMTFKSVTKPGKADVYLDLVMIEVTHQLKFKVINNTNTYTNNTYTNNNRVRMTVKNGKRY
jgi:hypothetical protein